MSNKVKELMLPILVLCIALFGVFYSLGEIRQIPPSKFPELTPDFSLEGVNGPVKMSDFHGEVSLVFFGYTHCPDVCPATLANIANALAELNEDEIQAINPIFISLDPERDNPEKAAAFAHHFDPRIIALTGTQAQVDAAKSAFAVGSQKQSKAGKDGVIDEKNYTISHSSYIFVVRPDGSMGNLLGHLDPPNHIAIKAKHWLRWAD
ncbi:MAG: SCO family protein [Mariprofundaceae bacterium]|nr:SCO family protein [Mariprofundaceae bacterium]